MDLITMEQLKEILKVRSDWCVSIFMPTHRVGQEIQQDPIRFKNLLSDVEDRLLAKGVRLPDVKEALKNPMRLLQSSIFWQHQSDGLAVFFTKDSFCFFRMPVKFVETLVITDRFHIKPILPILTNDGTFHILAISQNSLRFLEGTRYTVDEVDLGDTPGTLAEIFPDGFPKSQLQIHTGRAKPSGGGPRSAIFHADDPSDDIKEYMQKWFRIIDKTIVNLLSETKSPLVLAGVKNHFPLYKEINNYPYLIDEGIPGNPDEMKDEELHKKGWAIVEPVFSKEREAALAKYQQLLGTGQTTTDVAEAVLAAHQGKIASIFIAVNVQVWGRFDSENLKVDVHETLQPGDEDLLDFIGIQTLIKGGAVFAVPTEDIPDKALLAAVMRY